MSKSQVHPGRAVVVVILCGFCITAPCRLRLKGHGTSKSWHDRPGLYTIFRIISFKFFLPLSSEQVKSHRSPGPIQFLRYSERICTHMLLTLSLIIRSAYLSPNSLKLSRTTAIIATRKWMRLDF